MPEMHLLLPFQSPLEESVILDIPDNLYGAYGSYGFLNSHLDIPDTSPVLINFSDLCIRHQEAPY